MASGRRGVLGGRSGAARGPLALAVLGAVALAALGLARWLGTEPPAAPTPEVADVAQQAAPAPPPVAAAAPPREAPAPAPRAPAGSGSADTPPQALRMEVDPKHASFLEKVDEETLARWEARVARERAAQARFEQGLAESQVRARDIDMRVREALGRAELVPELRDGGLMTGLRIRALESGSALSEAGLREGDLLVRIGDHPLDDPAALPRVLAEAGPELSLCVERGGGELCRELALR